MSNRIAVSEAGGVFERTKRMILDGFREVLSRGNIVMRLKSTA